MKGCWWCLGNRWWGWGWRRSSQLSRLSFFRSFSLSLLCQAAHVFCTPLANLKPEKCIILRCCWQKRNQVSCTTISFFSQKGKLLRPIFSLRQISQFFFHASTRQCATTAAAKRVTPMRHEMRQRREVSPLRGPPGNWGRKKKKKRVWGKRCERERRRKEKGRWTDAQSPIFLTRITHTLLLLLRTRARPRTQNERARRGTPLRKKMRRIPSTDRTDVPSWFCLFGSNFVRRRLGKGCNYFGVFVVLPPPSPVCVN